MAINCKLNARSTQNILYSIRCPENGQSISDLVKLMFSTWTSLPKVKTEHRNLNQDYCSSS